MVLRAVRNLDLFSNNGRHFATSRLTELTLGRKVNLRQVYVVSKIGYNRLRAPAARVNSASVFFYFISHWILQGSSNFEVFVRNVRVEDRHGT